MESGYKKMIWNIFKALLMALFLSINLNTIDKNTDAKADMYLKLKQYLQPFLAINILTYLIYFIILILLIAYLKRNYYKTSLAFKSFSVLYSIILALCTCYGTIARKGNIFNYLYNQKYLIIFLVVVITWTIFFYLILEFLITYFNRTKAQKFIVEGSTINWRKWFCIILICWLPYIIILYPGTTNPDTINQLLEFFNHGNWVRDDYPIAWYMVPNNPFTISNQHNFLVTLFYGMNFKLGISLFHNAGIGVFINSIFQIIGLVAILTYALVTFSRLGMNNLFLRCFGIFFALFPMLPMIGMFLGKNVLYSIFLTWSFLLVVNALEQPKLFKESRWNIYLFLSLLGQLAVEKYAIYIIAFMAILVPVLFWRKNFTKKLVITMLGSLIGFLVVQGAIFEALHVPNGDPIEGKSVMIQSTALYQKYHPNDMTDYQKKVINKVFVRKNLANLYTPGLSDPVKSSGGKKIGLQPNGSFNQHLNKNFVEGYRYRTVTANDIKNYNKVWLQLMLKHPMTLFEAFMGQGYGYLDLQATQGDISVNTPADALNVAQVHHEIPIGSKSYTIDYTRHCQRLRKLIAGIYNVCSKIPPFAFLLNGNYLINISVICFLLILGTGRYGKALTILPILLQVPIFMLSPVNGSQRYMYPFFFTTFIVLGIVLCWKKTKNKESRKDSI
ncbi:DUF6020 family protein [Limosilactobacillus caviae]|uniref:Beta-carotene 15,15'-monooxygenase n=1 Tax=Limosilactobacillus caviae TaxID=1769424 RepID=A0ABQ2C657_9LACO|nr:DUF6020 family protein [Limosilactobacillus caviae]MCD7124492.1 DUF6020 family protein [Limosilactobacillus caviae]MRH46271.1 hypothetical protein [Limosilactobacillus reuteri]GGI63600.1 beta-carotene 15,15'-monooxygenase [Limosilactobacillus caviae]